MMQGEVASRGNCTGPPSGGVQAPEPLILPDPSRRFANTARRLESLASGHPMEEWLLFMMRVAQAQHAAATMSADLVTVEGPQTNPAVAARLAAPAAGGERRHSMSADSVCMGPDRRVVRTQ